MSSVFARLTRGAISLFSATFFFAMGGAAEAAQITGTAAPGFTASDAMSVFIAGNPPTFVQNITITDAQEGSCSTILLNGCLYTLAPGLAVNPNLAPTIIYDADHVTVSDVFGVTCIDSGDGCVNVLAFVSSRPGFGGLDLSVLGDISANPFGYEGTGPGGTSFDASSYLAPFLRDQNYHAVFISSNAVPEPSTYALFLAGLLGVGALRYRRKGARI